MREAKQQGATLLGIVNAGRLDDRPRDRRRRLPARRPEIGVASTKAFTSQVVVLAMLTVHLGRLRGTLTPSRGREIVRALGRLPEQVAEILELEPAIRSSPRSTRTTRTSSTSAAATTSRPRSRAR
jgi:glutamine---fructose-6-phosphate transaminase (isomerizing)